MDKLQTINLIGVQFDKKMTPQYIKPKMLLVEDNPESANLMQHLCQSINCNLNIKCVPSVESALNLLENDSHYDLIISDHFLIGQRTGVDLWKICKEKFKEIPFMITSGLTTKEFSGLVVENEEGPLFLSKTLSKETRKGILEKFLEETLAEQEKQSKNYAGFLFDTMTFIGIVITFVVLPNHLLSLKDPPPVAVNHQEYFQPVQIKVDSELKTDSQPQYQPIKVKEIITPQLRQKIDLIVKRADEINKL